jgi:beta-galactosidase
MKKILLMMVAWLPMMVSAQVVADFDKDWSFWSDRNPQKTIVSIPHDAMQSEMRSDTLTDGRHNGFFPGGFYHYEKQLQVSADWLQKHVTIHFEGVYQQSVVSINGTKVGGCVYGYLPFTVCADGLLREGTNTIRVDVDNSKVANSRWYTGAGIYRPVMLRVQNADHIEEVKLLTRDITDGKAIVNVATTHHGGLNVKVSLLWKGETVSTGLGTNVNLVVKNAHLWSDIEPNLYQVKVELLRDGKTVDCEVKDFGIRTLTWSPEGLLVNGRQTLLRGGCLHHDNGILGACEYRDAVYRKLKIMKEEYDFNAIRSSHMPCSETMLQVCDELGIYVMDELWDMWYLKKTPYDYSNFWEANHESDIEAMVRKDYSHPSVILYSIGNEVPEPFEQRGNETARQLVRQLHRLDPSRPVTAGINLTLIYLKKIGMSWTEAPGSKDKKKEEMSSEAYNKMVATAGLRMMKATLRPQTDSLTTPVLDALDIAGYNYASPRYEVEGREHPSRVILGSETYTFQLAENWAQVERLPYLIGDFMWTAWDYLGEVSIGAWYNTDENPSFNQQYPCLLSGVGAIDLIGHPTGEALRAKAVWQKDGCPYMAVRPVSKLPLVRSAWRGTNSIPSWSWRGEVGTPATVEVFTSAPSVRLYLNDKLVDEKATENCLATFELPYAEGELKAVTEKGECVLKSAKKNLQILAQTEENVYKPGELIYLNIDLTDAVGTIESNADRQLNVQVQGGELLAFGSAQPRTKDRFTSGNYTTYYGRSQAVLRANHSGKLVVTISGKGLKTVKKTIDVR